MPKFIHANFLNISVNMDTFLYDRIYVGTGVTYENADFLKSLLNINGILVMPLDDLVSCSFRKKLFFFIY